ncbi:MAG: hypothetical protein ACLTMP_07715 [Eggerthella lenta]
MMLKFCEAFLRHRKAVFALFAVAAVACACIPAVKVNYSMTDYLPATRVDTGARRHGAVVRRGHPERASVRRGHRPGHGRAASRDLAVDGVDE